MDDYCFSRTINKELNQILQESINIHHRLMYLKYKEQKFTAKTYFSSV